MNAQSKEYKISRSIKVIILLFCILLLWGASGSYAQEQKRVLFISSYSPNFSSFDKQKAGLIKGIGKGVNIQIEYMDFGEFNEEESEKNFYHLLKYKINKYKKFDVVVLADDYALEFGKKHRDDLFKDIPIVFLGVNDKKSATEAISLDSVYGIIETIPIETSVELISKLHKNKNIVGLTYSSSKDSKDLKEFYALKSKYTNLNFKHISLGDMSLEEFENKINQLNKDDVILSIYSPRSKQDDFPKMIKSIEILKENKEVPIYNTLDYLLEDSFIGGVVVSNFNLGKLAGEISKQIMSGDIPNNKLWDTKRIYEYIFDYSQLKKYNIKESKLPKNSYIKNKPISYFEKNKMVIIPMVIVIICLLVTIIGLVVNMNKRKIYEEEIIKAKEIAENANKSQSNFISNISHELRTPVAVIMSSSQLLDLNLNKSNDITKSTDNIKIIRQNCNRLLRLINNIIDVAKVDSGFTDLKLKNIEIISLLENIVSSIIPYAQSKELEIIFDTDEEEIIMGADPNKIERIVLNLLSNAIKFSDNGGKISVNVYKKMDLLIFTVQDTGVGIHEDNLEKIFEKFIQIEDTMIRKNEGSGIGLSLVKSFVKSHDGDVYVESKLNKGSIFTVELPIRVLDGEKVYFYNLDQSQSDIMSTSIEFSDIYI